MRDILSILIDQGVCQEEEHNRRKNYLGDPPENMQEIISSLFTVLNNPDI